MEHPVRVAFCPILFSHNGGSFTERGLPIISDPDEDGFSPRGKCDVAYDCGVCSLLVDWLNRDFVDKGWSVGWECQACLKETTKEDHEKSDRWLPGFYQEGRDQETQPHPELEDFDNTADNTPLKGCTRCGWQSSLLQLTLRRPKGGP